MKYTLPEGICKKDKSDYLNYFFFEGYIRNKPIYFVKYHNVYMQVTLEIDGDIFCIEDERLDICYTKLSELFNKHKEKLMVISAL